MRCMFLLGLLTEISSAGAVEYGGLIGQDSDPVDRQGVLLVSAARTNRFTAKCFLGFQKFAFSGAMAVGASFEYSKATALGTWKIQLMRGVDAVTGSVTAPEWVQPFSLSRRPVTGFPIKSEDTIKNSFLMRAVAYSGRGLGGLAGSGLTANLHLSNVQPPRGLGTGWFANFWRRPNQIVGKLPDNSPFAGVLLEPIENAWSGMDGETQIGLLRLHARIGSQRILRGTMTTRDTGEAPPTNLDDCFSVKGTLSLKGINNLLTTADVVVDGGPYNAGTVVEVGKFVGNVWRRSRIQELTPFTRGFSTQSGTLTLQGAGVGKSYSLTFGRFPYYSWSEYAQYVASQPTEHIGRVFSMYRLGVEGCRSAHVVRTTEPGNGGPWLVDPRTGIISFPMILPDKTKIRLSGVVRTSRFCGEYVRDGTYTGARPNGTWEGEWNYRQSKGFFVHPVSGESGGFVIEVQGDPLN
jgi:hypothetical protein